MDSRMSKYNEEEKSLSRVDRNQDLYKEINKSQIDGFDVHSNTTVLGNQSNEIDVEKLKKILDTRYNDTPKRKGIRVESKKEEVVNNEAPTKEYDLNVILEKAKDDKEETYEEVRAKKLRDTQFDILNNLNVKDKEEKDEKEDNLLNLINTITINETKKKDHTSIDLFEDLQGSDDTEVYQGIKDEIEKIEKTSKILNQTNNKITEIPKANKIDNSFYTSNNIFKEKDFNDDEYDENFLDDEKIGIGVKILIIIIVIVFVTGLFFFLKSIIGF